MNLNICSVLLCTFITLKQIVCSYSIPQKRAPWIEEDWTQKEIKHKILYKFMKFELKKAGILYIFYKKKYDL